MSIKLQPLYVKDNSGHNQILSDVISSLALCCANYAIITRMHWTFTISDGILLINFIQLIFGWA